MRAIRALPFVTRLSPVGARNSHGHGYQVSLRCSACEEYGSPSCEEYGSCGKKQGPPLQVSSRQPTSDDWDLADYRREVGRIQNRRSVALGSRADVPTPRKGQAVPLEHSRLGLVGWIASWSLGNCVFAVKIIVGLIRKLNLTESVLEPLEAHCLEGRPVRCAAGTRYKAAGEAGSRVSCQGHAHG
jgi:hypothetical protein